MLLFGIFALECFHKGKVFAVREGNNRTSSLEEIYFSLHKFLPVPVKNEPTHFSAIFYHQDSFATKTLILNLKALHLSGLKERYLTNHIRHLKTSSDLSSKFYNRTDYE